MSSLSFLSSTNQSDFLHRILPSSRLKLYLPTNGSTWMSVRHLERLKLNPIFLSNLAPLRLLSCPCTWAIRLYCSGKKLGFSTPLLLLYPTSISSANLLALSLKLIPNPTVSSHLDYRSPNPHHSHLWFSAGLPASLLAAGLPTVSCQHSQGHPFKTSIRMYRLCNNLLLSHLQPLWINRLHIMFSERS